MSGRDGVPPSLATQLRAECLAAAAAWTRSVEEPTADPRARAAARARSVDAEIALGGVGAEGEAARDARLAATIRALLRHRAPGRTICPSDAARAVGGTEWRALMPPVRAVAAALVESGWLEVTQRGRPVGPEARGAIRLRRRLRPEGDNRN